MLDARTERNRGKSRITIIPLSLRKANEMVSALHRHHAAIKMSRYCLGALDDANVLRGVAIVHSPASPWADRTRIVEVARLCTDGAPNVCSALYGACARVAKQMGYESIQTFILSTEPGTSLRASGWECVGASLRGQWDRRRSKVVTHLFGEKQIFWGDTKVKHLENIPKMKWSKKLNPPIPDYTLCDGMEPAVRTFEQGVLELC